MAFHMRSFIRRGSARILGHWPLMMFRGLADGTPLLLVAEPHNKAHAGAVRVRNMSSFSCGYVAREHADEVSARLRRGELLLCRAIGPHGGYHRDIEIWSEPDHAIEDETQDDPGADFGSNRREKAFT